MMLKMLARISLSRDVSTTFSKKKVVLADFSRGFLLRQKGSDETIYCKFN